MFVLSMEEVGVIIWFVTVGLAGLWLGYILAYFEVGFPYPPGYKKQRKSVFDSLLRFFGLQRVKHQSMSDMVIMDKPVAPDAPGEIVFPSPPVAPVVPELGKGVVLSADYSTHKVSERPKVTRFEED